jgi:hypothetical protein
MRQTVGLVRAGRQLTKVVKGGREALGLDPDSMSALAIFHQLANEGIARGKESDSPNPAFYTFSG